MTTKQTFTLPQIVNQLTTSWGFGDTDTRAWYGLSTITYSIPNVTPTNVAGHVPSEGGANLVTMTAHEIATANLAFALWDDLIPESLVNTGSTSADVTFNYSSKTQQDGTYTQSWDNFRTATSNTLTAGQVWIANDWSTNADAAIKNESYGNITYIHEIGHSLGLSHPGTYNAGSGVTITYANSAAFAQDNRENTVMSYFGGYDPSTGTWAQDGTSINYLYPDTPMVDDIAAIQALYGVDTTTRTGNTVYGFDCNITGPEQQIYDFSLNATPIYTIWDAGGSDVLDCGNYSGQQFIDLQPGSYSSIDGLNGNIAIAYGTTIETAIGGLGNDTIVGNSANNVIEGETGINTVIYSGNHTDYGVQQMANGWLQISDLRAGAPDGIDSDHNIQNFQFADGTFTATQLLSAPPVMKAVRFHAVESLTGDVFYGVVYDNGGRYQVGSTVAMGADQLGGHWTYTVDSIGTAAAAYQNAFYAGKVYDYIYVDAGLGASYYTNNGAVGFTNGNLDTTFYSGASYLGSDADAITIGSTTYQFGNNGQLAVPIIRPMMAVSFVAVEGITGDTINGTLFDNTGRYTVGSSVTTGPDQLGGHWNYTVTGIVKADAPHQDPGLSGFVYDTSYIDADAGRVYSTVYGSKGLASGDRLQNYSGNNYLGSDGDLVTVNANTYAIASGKYVVPTGAAAPPAAMRAVTFRAVESVTGDVINGVLFENDGRYTVGSSVSDGPDVLGGTWTYTVTAIAAADATHQSAAFAGFVYDTSYVDADLGKTLTTIYGATGLATGDRTNNYSGSNYLGSEGDVVIINNATFAIASGKYVVPDQASAPTSNMTMDTFQAVESVTGDTISGVLFDNTNRYTVGSSATIGTDQLGGTWTYTVTTIAAADAAHQNAALSGYVYDTSYFDVGLSANFATLYGANGLASGDRSQNYSGSNYLASDGDLVSVGGTIYAIASGKHVVPPSATDSAPMATDAPLAGGDGVSSANLALLGNYAAASFATGSGPAAPLTAPMPETSPLIAPPVA